jgi:hypothetical protein
MLFYVSKFQRSSSNGLEMAAIKSQGMKTEILFLVENLLNFQFHDFFPLGMALNQLSLEAPSWPIFIVLKNTKKCKNF